MTDLYAELGVDHQANAEEIKYAHRQKAKKVHPDTPDGDEDKFKALQHAYDVLSDAERRRRYDETGDDEAQPTNSKEVALRTGIAQIVEMLVSKAITDDVSRSDLHAFVMDHLEKSLAGIKVSRVGLIKAATAIDKMMEHWKCKEAGEDPLKQAILFKRQEIKSALVRLSDNQDLNERLTEFFKGYHYDFDKAPEEPMTLRDLGHGHSGIFKRRGRDFSSTDNLY